MRMLFSNSLTMNYSLLLCSCKYTTNKLNDQEYDSK